MTTPDLFAVDSALAAQVPNYVPRAVQQQMGAAVTEAIDCGEHLLVEAGTGTGKTLAYLLPAMNSAGRVIISTATRHLQEQVFENDIPLAQRALNKSSRTKLLKGRSNYLCLHRLERTEAAGDLRSQQLQIKLREIREWASVTQTGDLGEVGDIDDGSPIWSRVSSTTDNCLGSECPMYSECWVMAARRAAQEADILVVNHHLLFADLALKEEGFGELLPGADAVIMDEAHHLPTIAGQFFGESVSGRQIRDLVRDVRAESESVGDDMPAIREYIADLAQAETDFIDAIYGMPGHVAWTEVLAKPAASASSEAILEALNSLVQALASVADRSEGLAAVGTRAAELAERCARRDQNHTDSVTWLQRHGSGWRRHTTPLDVAPPFAKALERHPGAWIFTSATLSVNGSLDYFASRMGLPDAHRLILDSPFDYENNSLLYVPTAMPMPNDPEFDRAVADNALMLIRASKGGAFVLCTSYRGVHACAAALREAAIEPLLVQGELGRSELLDAFRRSPEAVLIGTGSFWEGVDVRGHGLRLVIIDRLPFASPSDPVLSARVSAMRDRGEQPFMTYQVPQAVIALKQGAGRLIRDVDDRGVLAICDPRLVSKGYGRIFRDSLPAMPLTRDDEVTADFLEELVPA